MSRTDRIHDRELSWLGFNGRVLQEAQRSELAPLDRLRFLAIVSSNLDEFFRVRVASLRSALRLKKKKRAELGFQKTRKRLRAIHEAVLRQQSEFGRTLREQILPELARRGVPLWDERTAPPATHDSLRRYFDERVAPLLDPVPLRTADTPLFLEDRSLYLACVLRDPEAVPLSESEVWILRVPVGPLPRFVEVTEAGGGVLFVDDVIRLHLPRLFPGHRVEAAWSVKLSRDADLDVDDEFSGDLVEKVRSALERRGRGVPARFLYDAAAPAALVQHLKDRLALEDDDLVAGWRYHNLHDLGTFPTLGRAVQGAPLPSPRPLRALAGPDTPWEAIRAQDRLLQLPYQSFTAVLDVLGAAAADPQVTEIQATLYRVAADSRVAAALMAGARRGARVVAFVEVKARFDEASNLDWARAMEDAGVRVLYSKPGIKVHSKLVSITRQDADGERRYAYLATGNLNESTARFYTDLGLFTADPRLTDDVAEVFRALASEDMGSRPTFGHLLVAPWGLRSGFEQRIEAEIDAAVRGRPAGMTLKMNALEDEAMIERLYDASAAGVPIDLIVRGICCLKPGVPGLSESIRARSLVGPFLEHSRAYRFVAGGEEQLYLASADWMTRNLDRRVEVAFPLYDREVRRQVSEMLDRQLRDNVRARVIDADQTNRFVPEGSPRVDSQLAAFDAIEG
ncbi:MAG: polyphosphate kinase 1 [Gemmatimonadota bacterium]